VPKTFIIIFNYDKSSTIKLMNMNLILFIF